MTPQEIEKLDSEDLRQRMTANARERQALVYTDAYLAELAREQMLLDSRNRQILDQAALFNEVQHELVEEQRQPECVVLAP